jgi:DnaD/phage-associated family protein
MITGDFFEDDYFGELDRDIRLLWLGMIISAADDQGRMFNSPALLRAKIFLYDTDLDDDFIVRSVRKLAKDGKIICYVKNNKPLIQIVKWWTYQTPSWASLSKFEPPDNWVDRAKFHTIGSKVEIVNWDKQGGYVGELKVDLTAIDDCDCDGDCDCDCDCDGEAEPAATAANAFEVYQQEIGLITSHISERLKADIDDYTEPWVIDAILIASGANARNMKYIEAILSRWKTSGKDDGTKPQREYRGRQPTESVSDQNARVAQEVMAEMAKGKL